MVKVTVPQQDGEIVITPGGVRDTVSYPVSAGQVDVPEEHLEYFLLHVDGAEVVETVTVQAPASASSSQRSGSTGPPKEV